MSATASLVLINVHCLTCLEGFFSFTSLGCCIILCFLTAVNIVLLCYDNLDGFTCNVTLFLCLIDVQFMFLFFRNEWGMIVCWCPNQEDLDWGSEFNYLPLVDISLPWTWWAHGARSPGLIVWGEEHLAPLDMRNLKTISTSSHMRCSATYSGQYNIPPLVSTVASKCITNALIVNPFF